MKEKTNSKMENEYESFLFAIKNIKSKQELKNILHKTKWRELRYKNGGNVLHMVAQNTPELFRGALNVILDIESSHPENGDCVGLINERDRVGRLPLEYFLCYADIFAIFGGNLGNFGSLEKIVETYNLEKPDWLEVKLLIAENYSIRSAVDQVDESIWVQRNPRDFKACLKTERGKKLIALAAENDFRYKNKVAIATGNIGRDLEYSGLDIRKYTHPNEDEIDRILIYAQTKGEVRLYLKQFCYIMFFQEDLDYYGGYESDLDEKIRRHAGRQTKKYARALMDKAIKMGLAADILDMNNKMIESFNECGGNPKRIENFNSFMSSYFPLIWDNLSVIGERDGLMRVVKNKPKCLSAGGEINRKLDTIVL